ncbi:UDP-N-acetylmuramate dehydrogenase [Elusimicrobium simillimum]|uniref:UDP-N-acetylmuramate dehydrogenase n=1 Tax=Elusimicrobium simillimum TaxID=3143438 RepID=UPI003C6FB159
MDFKEELKEFFGENCQFDAPMSEHTTYKTGGKAEALVYPKTVEDWSFVLKLANLTCTEIRIIGFGSNILVSDKGLPGITCSTKRMEEVSITGDTVKAEAGLALDKLIEIAVEDGLAGMEKMSGIPGSIGGAVRMNAGAFGQETFDSLEYFEVIDYAGHPSIITKDKIDYGYRSVPGIEDYIIISAAFKLKKDDYKALTETRNLVLNKRILNQPLDLPSAGSVFKRPAGDYASRLIDEAGLRGLSIGGAKVSEKHAGFIVNFNQATAEDIKNLMDEVKRIVKEKSGVTLELEQILWGQF